MNERINALLTHKHINRFLAIGVAVMMVANLSTLGPVSKKTNDGPPSLDNPSANGGSFNPVPSAGGPTPTASSSGGPVTPVVPTPGVTGGTPLPKPTIDPSKIPHFGLITQGVTATTVRIGISENFSNCGDAGSLAAANPAVVGDVSKAIDTYVEYINSTGGIGGRRLIADKIDDGGTCTSKNIAAAKEMLLEKKDFIAIPGLDVESEWLIDRKLPVFGGANDDNAIASYGPNGLMLLEPAGPTFEAWASFGKYYIGTGNATPCLIRIANGAAGDFDALEKILVAKMAKYGLKFKKIIQFPGDDPSRAQEISENTVEQAQSALCDQIYFMAGNPVGLIFMTDAATRKNYFPKVWTFNSLTALSDDDLAGHLMDQVQWQNAVGLSYRVPAAEHPKAGNCQRIYEARNGKDGQEVAAAQKIFCAKILTVSEMMRRAVRLTGVLNADTFLLGADSINDDFYYDATLPLDYKFPSPAGPFKTRAWSHYTVVKWDVPGQTYKFPEYPCYYRTFKANNGGCEDLSATFAKAK